MYRNLELCQPASEGFFMRLHPSIIQVRSFVRSLARLTVHLYCSLVRALDIEFMRSPWRFSNA